MPVCILKTLKPDVSVIISRPALSQENKKNFRIKVEAIQQRRRPHISAMRQAEYTKDEAADWSLGQEEWSIRSAILQNELFVLIHLSGKIKTIKYYFTVLLNMYTVCLKLPQMLKSKFYEIAFFGSTKESNFIKFWFGTCTKGVSQTCVAIPYCKYCSNFSLLYLYMLGV